MIRKHSPTPATGAHRYAVRVYYEDTDAGGVVYHATYLRYAERARTEAMRDLGIPHAELVRECNLMFVVRRAELDYVRPAHLDDSLTVTTELTALGGATVELRQRFWRAGEELAAARLSLACVRGGDGRPGRIPPRWREGLARLAADGRPGRAGPEGLGRKD
jgi:acyl-CoA thioester hydrolase